MTNEGPEPAMYALTYQGGGKGEQLRMNFAGGGVTDVAIVPRHRASPRTIPVTKEQLEKVFDPLSGAFLYAHSDNPNGDARVCEQQVPVFDGRQRFDLVLTPKRVVQVKRDPKSGGYAGPAVICQVRFIPIAGYQPENPGIQLMSQSDEIEVWLVPLRGTSMYVPYRIVLPTPIGYGSALGHLVPSQGSAAREQRSRAAAISARFVRRHRNIAPQDVVHGPESLPIVNGKEPNPKIL